VPEDPFTGKPIAMEPVATGIVFYVRDPRHVAVMNLNALKQPDHIIPVDWHMTAVRLNFAKKP
jgi:hypothetical protein